MKYLSILFFVLFTNFIQAQTSNSNQKAVIKTTLYCSHCEQCETCGQNFKTNLYKIKGLRSYELDAENMTITVFYNAKKTDLNAIKSEISKLGFDADEVKADEKAYNSLDECCKKK